MGEYAEFSGGRIKIGTCEDLGYLRIEDIHRVGPVEGSVNVRATPEGSYFRLPFPDEDMINPGGYNNMFRGARLSPEFNSGDEDYRPGNIQLKHECGLLVNMPCYHGAKLPDVEGCKDTIRCFWNGKSWFFELYRVKCVEADQDEDGKKKFDVKPMFRCRHCGNMWSCEWEEIVPYIVDGELKKRLKNKYLT